MARTYLNLVHWLVVSLKDFAQQFQSVWGSESRGNLLLHFVCFYRLMPAVYGGVVHWHVIDAMFRVGNTIFFRERWHCVNFCLASLRGKVCVMLLWRFMPRTRI